MNFKKEIMSKELEENGIPQNTSSQDEPVIEDETVPF